MTKNCLICKKVFKSSNKNSKYCGRSCYYEMKKIRHDKVNWTTEMKERMSRRYMGNGNPMFGKESQNKGKSRPEMTGEKHFAWKGGFWINQDGYKIIENSSVNKGEKTLEHRYVMEQYLGRKLISSEIIHHINGNKRDNRIENLVITTRVEHPTLHAMKNI